MCLQCPYSAQILALVAAREAAEAQERARLLSLDDSITSDATVSPAFDARASKKLQHLDAGLGEVSRLMIACKCTSLALKR